jgi:hypothetical protein
LYGKVTDPGDTAIVVDSGGHPSVVLKDFTSARVDPASSTRCLLSEAGSLVYLDTFLYAFNGLSYERLRTITTLKTSQATALASGSDLTVWTPAAGKKFRLRGLRVRASVAGRYEARDASGTVIAYFYLAANQLVEVLHMEANGYLSAAANNALLIRNQSGSAADLDAIATGNEE